MGITADPTAIAAFVAITVVGFMGWVMKWYLGRNEKRHESHEQALAKKVDRDELQGMVTRLSAENEKISEAVRRTGDRVDTLANAQTAFHLDIVERVARIAAKNE